MILGGMTPLYEGMRLHFKSNQEIAMDRSSFLREAASSNSAFEWDAQKAARPSIKR
jgi:hypothetical protein